MSNRKTLLCLLVSLVLAWPPSVWAQASPTAELEGERVPVVREAGKAIFGRVFGIRDQGGDIDYYVFDLSGRSRRGAAVRSFFVPGWGQIYNRQRLKGGVLFVTAGAAFLGSLVLNERSKDSFDDYVDSGFRNGSEFDDYERERSQAIILASVSAALWVFGVIDAHRNAFNPLWGGTQQQTSIDVSILEDETRIYWRKRF